MYTSSIIATFTSILVLTSASPSALHLKACSPAVVNVTVKSSPLNSNNLQASAIQVIVGEFGCNEDPKICIGNDGFSPCQASMLSISPWGNTVDINNVECQGFYDIAMECPATGWFTVGNPAILSTTGTENISVVICTFVD
jgi:hypothetical protein